MGGKSSKKKKGNDVNDPKEEREGSMVDQVEKQEEQAPASTTQQKTEPEPPDVSSTAVETAPSEESSEKAATLTEEKASSPNAATEAPMQGEKKDASGGETVSQSAQEGPKAGEQATATELSLQANELDLNAACTPKQKVVPAQQDTSEQSPVESQDVQRSSKTADGPYIYADVSSEEIENKGPNTEEEPVADGSPPKEDHHLSAVHEVEPVVTQTQKDFSENMPSEIFVPEISQTLEADRMGDTSAPTGVPEVGLMEDSPAVLDDSLEVTAETVASEHEKSHVPDHQSTPEILPGMLPDDTTIGSTEINLVNTVNESGENETAYTQTENLTQAPISEAEDKTFNKDGGPSESSKDTETKTSKQELSSVKEAPADEKMENADLKDIIQSPTRGNTEVGEMDSCDPSPSAKISTIPNEVIGVDEEIMYGNGEPESSAMDTVRYSKPEHGSPSADQTSMTNVDKPAIVQQEYVDGIADLESPDKSNKGKDYEIQKESEPLENVNSPVMEMQSVTRASEGLELI